MATLEWWTKGLSVGASARSRSTSMRGCDVSWLRKRSCGPSDRCVTAWDSDRGEGTAASATRSGARTTNSAARWRTKKDGRAGSNLAAQLATLIEPSSAEIRKHRCGGRARVCVGFPRSCSGWGTGRESSDGRRAPARDGIQSKGQREDDRGNQPSGSQRPV